MSMEFQMSMIMFSSVLVSICCGIWLWKEFRSMVQRLVEKILKELDEIED